MNHPPPKQSANPSTRAVPALGPKGRAVGLDLHPDTFAAAVLEGREALGARVRLNVTQQPLEALCAWAARHTTAEDVLILEASANSFAIAERLTALGRQVYILESHRAGQIGKSYLANDKVDAVKIARIYLSGLGIQVWQPDAETRQRRELLGTCQRCVKESTRAQQHLRSYLGLNPSVVESGNSAGSGALHSHGRGSLRALLIQASKRLLTTVNPLQKWGLSVALRRGTNKAAVCSPLRRPPLSPPPPRPSARKLTVAVWHVLQGHWNQTLEETTTLLTKLGKLATDLGLPPSRSWVTPARPPSAKRN